MNAAFYGALKSGVIAECEDPVVCGTPTLLSRFRPKSNDTGASSVPRRPASFASSGGGDGLWRLRQHPARLVRPHHDAQYRREPLRRAGKSALNVMGIDKISIRIPNRGQRPGRLRKHSMLVQPAVAVVREASSVKRLSFRILTLHASRETLHGCRARR